MKFKIAIILLSLLFLCKVEAQINSGSEGLKLEVNFPTQKNKKIYLGRYWESATFAIDSLQLSDEGKATFTSEEKLPEGQYFLHIKPTIQFDFLAGSTQDNIILSLNENDFSKNTVTGSNDTKLLWEYLNYSEQKRLEKSNLEGQLKDTLISEKKKDNIQKKINELDIDTKKYIDTFIKNHDGSWVGIFIKGLTQIGLPYPTPKDDNENRINRQYIKDHYFDNINLTDPRLWRTNYLTTYIDNYMQQWVEPKLDSLSAAASHLVARAKENEFCFKQMLSKLTNESIKSLNMGYENIWARLYEDYIKDKNLTWIDSTQVRELERMYEAIKYNRIGMTAHNLTLGRIDGDTINTNELQAEYLLIYFYDPGCIHCKKELPRIHNELYPKYKKSGLEVVAMNVASDIEEWKDFISKNNLTDWINCADPDYKSKYWEYFDTTGVPVTFILNRDKKIIGKKIHEQNLEILLDYYIQHNDGTN